MSLDVAEIARGPRSHRAHCTSCTCHTTDLPPKFREGSELRRAPVRFQCSSPASGSVQTALLEDWTALRVPCCCATVGGGRLQRTMLYLQGKAVKAARHVMQVVSHSRPAPQEATLEHCRGASTSSAVCGGRVFLPDRSCACNFPPTALPWAGFKYWLWAPTTPAVCTPMNRARQLVVV
ncbi:uncharacterized protein M421DRAFT_288021 [Didymella exigua CBS 183.55]|uniref:Uncharacterized protein n=1 Tax=Didymella exigua CBS 183.55 TaxID=1150837 RepID=A0A6A5S438_9PLEO|nr:uncharacterized protein M421DRAFT_288021 [Didymella exigua CBS 183.55]KAF1932267.1 hypothetical protein M421DRAFT_288021 [Didymella exigua CBS 183.55]